MLHKEPSPNCANRPRNGAATLEEIFVNLVGSTRLRRETGLALSNVGASMGDLLGPVPHASEPIASNSVGLGLVFSAWPALVRVLRGLGRRPRPCNYPPCRSLNFRSGHPAGLLGVFLFWQTVPLITLSTGASLQLNKIQIYPVPTRALFGIEVLLRLTGSPEMVLLLSGALVGLLRHPSVSPFSAMCLLFFFPINLFFSLAIREAVLHSFERNRFRELFAILIISIGIIPQFILRSQLGSAGRSAVFSLRGACRSRLGKPLPSATLSFHFSEIADLLRVARHLLFHCPGALPEIAPVRGNNSGRKLQPGRTDRAVTVGGSADRNPWHALHRPACRARLEGASVACPDAPFSRGLRDGMRIQRSDLYPVHLAQRRPRAEVRSLSNNFVLIVTLYGLLIFSDTLLLNAFGLDGAGAQIYFVAPMSLKPVLWAKNIVAIIFVSLQWAPGSRRAGHSPSPGDVRQCRERDHLGDCHPDLLSRGWKPELSQLGSGG